MTGRGKLDEHECMMLLEHRGSAKTAVELREMVADIDQSHDHFVSFIEWCCAVYNKSYAGLNDFVDEEARARAMEEAMKFGEEARKVEEEIERVKAQKEAEAAARAAELERESKMVRMLKCDNFQTNFLLCATRLN